MMGKGEKLLSRKIKIICILIMCVLIMHVIYNYTPIIINQRIENKVYKERERLKLSSDSNYELKVIDKLKSNGITYYVLEKNRNNIKSYIFVEEISILGYKKFNFTSHLEYGISSQRVVDNRVLLHGMVRDNHVKIVRIHFTTGEIVDVDLRNKPYFLYYASKNLTGARIQAIDYI